MRYLRKHIESILTTYKGEVPLAHFLKGYFKQYPILGSRDRKILSAMAYSWYRCAKGIAGDDRTYTVLEQWFGNDAAPGMVTQWLTDNGWLRNGTEFDINKLFPFDMALSAGISKEAWLQSMLVQPDLFIRTRKDTSKIAGLLAGKGIPYRFITDTCMALPNGAAIDSLLPPDSYVVQDASSQQTGTYFKPIKNEHWYDCCAGAGGKSLLLKDLEPSVRLTISDKRQSIIHNLKQRFQLYHHAAPIAYVTDVADSELLHKTLEGKQFDNIICDAPCSGSGTWARTPEQLYFFKPGTISEFASLQQRIACNAARYLKPGGRLIYITCSVFRHENEDVATAICERTGLGLLRSELINGTQIHADSMFVAMLQKKS